jgi:hypothetical protein
MKIIYTESGLLALEAFKDRQVKELEARISSNKYVFGDEVVEITASDIKQASEPQVASIRYSYNRNSQKTIFQLYIVMGVLIAIGGLFYQDLLSLFYHSPIQLTLFLSGLALSITSYAMLYRIKNREREIEHLVKIEKETSKNS